MHKKGQYSIGHQNWYRSNSVCNVEEEEASCDDNYDYEGWDVDIWKWIWKVILLANSGDYPRKMSFNFDLKLNSFVRKIFVWSSDAYVIISRRNNSSKYIPLFKII